MRERNLRRQAAFAAAMMLIALGLAIFGGQRPTGYQYNIGSGDRPFVSGMTTEAFDLDQRDRDFRLTQPLSSFRFPGWAGRGGQIGLYAYLESWMTSPPTLALTMTIKVGDRYQGQYPTLRGWYWFTFTVSGEGDVIDVTTPHIPDKYGLRDIGIQIDTARLILFYQGKLDFWDALTLLLIAGLSGWLLGRLSTPAAVAGCLLVAGLLTATYLFGIGMAFYLLYAPTVLMVLVGLVLVVSWRRPVLRVGGWLFFGMLCLYLFFSNGSFSSDDDRIKHATTLSLTRFALQLEPPIYGQTFSKYPIGHSLFELPLLAPLRMIDKLSGGQLPRLHELSAFLLNPLMGAFTVLLLYLTARHLYGRARLALAVALIGGLATITAAYALLTFSDTITSCMLLLSFYALLRYFDEGRQGRWLLLTGLASASLVMTRQELILAVAVMGGWWLLRSWRLRGQGPPVAVLRHSLLLVGPVLLAIALNLVYNLLREGALSSPAYETIGLLLPPLDDWLRGLSGMFISSGKSIFLYSPPLLLLPFAVLPFARRWRWEAGLIAALSLVLVLFYCRLRFWSGDLAWGTRYLVPLTPLLCLPLGALLSGYAGWSRWARTMLGLMVGWGLAVQLLAALTSFEVAFFRQYPQPNSLNYHEWQFVPERSALLAHLRILSEGHYNVPFSTQISSFGLPPLLDYLLPALLISGALLVGRQLWGWSRAGDQQPLEQEEETTRTGTPGRLLQG